MANFSRSNALPEPWVEIQQTGPDGAISIFFSNPHTGQRFYSRKELNRYLAYAQRQMQCVPQCAWATQDSKSKVVKTRRRSKARPEGKADGKAKLKTKGIRKMKSRGKAVAKCKSKGNEVAKPSSRRMPGSEHCIDCGKIGCICFDAAN